jgi:hypothetical protein
MDITYDYVFLIDTENGKTDLSPTVTYSELNLAGKNAVSGLGLATVYRSDYLSVFAMKVEREREADNNVTSSRTSRFTEVAFGGDEDFSTVDHRGDKQWYDLNGVTHQTNVSVLNLVGVAASATGRNFTVFESENDNVVGSAYIEKSSAYQVNLKYRKDLILVSYPEWSGEQIIHDPSYSTAYVSSPPAESSTPSSTIQTSDSTTSGAPGFEVGTLLLGIFSVGLIVILRRRK